MSLCERTGDYFALQHCRTVLLYSRNEHNSKGMHVQMIGACFSPLWEKKQG
jgi:hypothetical protein